MIFLDIMKKVLRGFTPPFIYSLLSRIKISQKKNKNKYSWQTIRAGSLQGRHLFFPNNKEKWQENMLEGTFDQFMFDYLNKLDVSSDAVIFDIGSHIGYHALSFASLLGDKVIVYAFEPNKYNMSVLRNNLEKNKDLLNQIKLFDFALTDKTGQEIFYFSDDINGKSSGSFIDSADTYYAKTENYLNSFKKTKVKTYSIDDLLIEDKVPVPQILKIDVEGAEAAVLKGAINLLNKYRPLLLIEVHSIYNMLVTVKLLCRMKYKIELLKEENDGRCFIAGEPQQN